MSIPQHNRRSSTSGVSLAKEVHPNHVGMIVQPSEWELDRRRASNRIMLSLTRSEQEDLWCNHLDALANTFNVARLMGA